MVRPVRRTRRPRVRRGATTRTGRRRLPPTVWACPTRRSSTTWRTAVEGRGGNDGAAGVDLGSEAAATGGCDRARQEAVCLTRSRPTWTARTSRGSMGAVVISACGGPLARISSAQQSSWVRTMAAPRQRAHSLGGRSARRPRSAGANEEPVGSPGEPRRSPRGVRTPGGAGEPPNAAVRPYRRRDSAVGVCDHPPRIMEHSS